MFAVLIMLAVPLVIGGVMWVGAWAWEYATENPEAAMLQVWTFHLTMTGMAAAMALGRTRRWWGPPARRGLRPAGQWAAAYLRALRGGRA